MFKSCCCKATSFCWYHITLCGSEYVLTLSTLIGGVGDVSLVINLPGASRFKVQKFVPCGAIRSMFPLTLDVFLEVAGHSIWLLCNPGSCTGLLP